jgi:hypothetical protein
MRTTDPTHPIISAMPGNHEGPFSIMGKGVMNTVNVPVLKVDEIKIVLWKSYVPCYNTTHFFTENAAINIPRLDLMVCIEGTDSYGQFL